MFSLRALFGKVGLLEKLSSIPIENRATPAETEKLKDRMYEMIDGLVKEEIDASFLEHEAQITAIVEDALSSALSDDQAVELGLSSKFIIRVYW